MPKAWTLSLALCLFGGSLASADGGEGWRTTAHERGNRAGAGNARRRTEKRSTRTARGLGSERPKPPALRDPFHFERATRSAGALELMRELAHRRPGVGHTIRALRGSPYFRRMNVRKEDYAALARRLEGLGRAASETDLERILGDVFPVVGSGAKKLGREFDVELKTERPRDQCKFLSCWAVTTVAKAEVDAGLGERFSYRYLYAHYLRSRILEHLYDDSRRSFDWAEDVRETGEFWKAVALARHFGLYPDRLWPEQKGYESEQASDALRRDVERTFGRYYDRRRALVREGLDEEKRRAALADLRKATREELLAVTERRMGKLPSGPFSHRGRTTTAQALGQEVFPPSARLRRIVYDKAWGHRDEDYAEQSEMVVYPPEGDPVVLRVETATERWPLDRMLDFVKSTLDATGAHEDGAKTRTFFASYHHPNRRSFKYFENGRGRMTAPARPARRKDTRHAVTIVGYEMDFYGKVIGLKLLNSLGSEIGQGGYFHMDREFMENYLFDINFVDPE